MPTEPSQERSDSPAVALPRNGVVPTVRHPEAGWGTTSPIVVFMPWGDRRRAEVWVVAMTVVSALLTGCASSTADPASTGPVSSHTGNQSTAKPAWIVADWAIADMEKAGLPSNLVTYFFDNPGTYLIVHSGKAKVDAAIPKATRVERFTSYATLQAAVSQGSLMPGVSALMYDNEAWSFTPPSEQSNPMQYAAQAETLAHQHHLKIIFAPAANLAELGAAANGAMDKYGNYLAQHLATGSRVSDVFDIQSQQAEGTPQFASFVDQAVGQARDANPGAILMAGIGPNPGGRTVTSTQVLDALQSVRTQVSGFWLNLPAGTPECPQCGRVQPQVAVQVLKSLASSLGVQG